MIIWVEGEMKTPYVWIVEMQFARRGKWHPTIGCALERAGGRNKMQTWRGHNPDDGFRLRQYMRRPK